MSPDAEPTVFIQSMHHAPTYLTATTVGVIVLALLIARAFRRPRRPDAPSERTQHTAGDGRVDTAEHINRLFYEGKITAEERVERRARLRELATDAPTDDEERWETRSRWQRPQ